MIIKAKLIKSKQKNICNKIEASLLKRNENERPHLKH